MIPTHLIILGNVLSGLGMTCFFISTLFHSKQRIIGIQSINLVLSTVAGIVLRGYSGAVQDAISLVRNLVVLKNRQNRVLSILFVAASLVLGFAFNNRGLIGVLPIVGSVQYAIVVLNPKTTEMVLKASICLSTALWAVYGFYLYNYVNAVANIVIAVTALYQLIRAPKITGAPKPTGCGKQTVMKAEDKQNDTASR